MEWFRQAFKNYANFKGRARRKDYWNFVLGSIFILIFLLLFEDTDDTNLSGEALASARFLLCLIYVLFLLLPTLAVLVRRLHDTGKSGWWFFILLIPLIGAIWLFFLLVADSQPGSNRYGPNPKEVSQDYRRWMRKNEDPGPGS